jgi:hypothetical protein
MTVHIGATLDRFATDSDPESSKKYEDGKSAPTIID